MPNPSSTPEQELIAAVSTERLIDATKTIAQWVRLSGTPEEARPSTGSRPSSRRSG